jgi:hypothetical protein
MDGLLALLPAQAQDLVELMMSAGTREYRSDFARRYFGEGKAEGKAEGEADALLTVLATRGFEVSEDARNRITACDDLEQLKMWIARAVTITAVEQLFD